MEVNDLFRDIQDGRILMALLEELSGCKLVRFPPTILQHPHSIQMLVRLC
jgi:hypothetical protein